MPIKNLEKLKIFKMKIIYQVLAFSLCLSCTFKQGGEENEKPSGHYRLYTQPYAIEESLPEEVKRIIIVSTNDFNGNITPTTHLHYSQNFGGNTPYQLGGLAYFSSYLKILRSKYSGEVMLLDAGNSLQGTLLTNLFHGSPTLKIFDYLDYDAIVLGPNDLIFADQLEDSFQNNIQNKMNEVSFPVIASNFYDIAKGQPVSSKNMLPYLLKEVNGIKVGIIGITSQSVISKHKKELFTGVYVESAKKSIFETAALLKNKGAQINLLLMSTDIRCGDKAALEKKLPLEKVNFNPQIAESCQFSEEFKEIFGDIPKNYIHAIITGGQESKVANFINKVPVIQSFGGGESFSRLELYYDTVEEKIISEKTLIHQPTMICHSFFESSQDCYWKDKSINHDQLTAAQFLGVPIEEDSIVNKMLEPYDLKVKKLAQKKIINLKESFEHKNEYNSPFATFVIDNITKKLNADIGLIYENSVREGLKQGSLTYSELFKALPFNSSLLSIKMKGKKIRDIITKSLKDSSQKTIYVSGINIFIKDDKISIFLDDGSILQDNKEYILATVDFIDSYIEPELNQVINKIHSNKRKSLKMNYRDIVLESLSKATEIDSTIKKYNLTKRITVEESSTDR